MTFFIVEFRIYRLAQPARRRLLRSNLPAVAATQRWVHCKVPHLDPEALVRARPDSLAISGLRVPTYGGDWEFDGELGVWIFRAASCPEDHAVELHSLSTWNKGRYGGEIPQTYRDAAEVAAC